MNTDDLITTSPKVAIVFPVYNVEKYLFESIDSILKQTYRNFVIFAIDDGSTDNSGEMLDRYSEKDPRLVVIHKKNEGLASTRNFALDQISSRGDFDFIASVDSDDVVDPDFLSCLVENALLNKSDVTVCGFYQFNDSHKWQGVLANSKNFDQDEFVELIYSTRRWWGINGAGGMVWKMLFKASLLTTLRFPLDTDILEDELFCMSVATKAKTFYYVAEALYGYRQNRDSLIFAKDFPKRMFKARLINIDVAKQISDSARLIALSAFIDSCIWILKDTSTSPLITKDFMLKYRPYVIEAYNKNLISKRTKRLFYLFCDYPKLANVYRYVRRLKHSVKFWKKRKSKK